MTTQEDCAIGRCEGHVKNIKAQYTRIRVTLNMEEVTVHSGHGSTAKNKPELRNVTDHTNEEYISQPRVCNLRLALSSSTEVTIGHQLVPKLQEESGFRRQNSRDVQKEIDDRDIVASALLFTSLTRAGPITIAAHTDIPTSSIIYTGSEAVRGCKHMQTSFYDIIPLGICCHTPSVEYYMVL
ncbi:hypothetical protein BJ508DRAFT_307328 [Ascobolus immersus RN42]|uniref:Uncharacterized protein n=1 Tax=Ascobolus immersus RN42 TaxID=1160509 RepID=A0A3N4I8Q2_ASCIM|nr:hypothetical protein BJ508DRAFT_307328 [Ascobolus immersus RN42]